MARLTKRQIDAVRLRADGETKLWDDDPRGLGVRIKPSGVATFFVQYTSPGSGRKARYTIGQYGRLTLQEARREARKVLGQVAGGNDPARERRLARQTRKLHARNVSELCDQYLKDAEAGLVTYRGRPKKASTLATDRGRIARHIKPLLGSRSVKDVTLADVTAFFHAVRRGETAITVKTKPRGVARVTGGAGTASRTLGLLGGIFSYAIKAGLRPNNPVRGFERPPSGHRDRVLSPEEYRRLGQALETLENERANATTLAAVRVLALTGCRRGEIFGLHHERVDRHRQVLRLADTKTGPQMRPIGRAACKAIPMGNAGWVFPAARGNGPLTDMQIFRRAVARAKLADVTLHTLRHGYASVALELGYGELTIAGLLGHRLHSVTAGYAHHMDRALVVAADRVADAIAGWLDGRASAQVVPLPSERGG